jgi:coproporphyrinogen III oxidase
MGGCFEFAPLNRQNTQYNEDHRNFARLCDEHQEEVDEYWKERWDEYWGGRI